MKVTFIQPGSDFLLDGRSMPPLGILYLSSWLRKFGHDVNIIDLAGVDNWQNHIKKEIHKLDGTDYIGITCTTPQYFQSIKIKDFLHSKGFAIPIVVGGIHITSTAHVNEIDYFNTDGFDSYCVGEGFNAVTKMCDDFPKLKKIYAEPILKDVNDLPFAARDLIDIKGYRYKLGDVPSTTFYSQWGCIYSCQYCESPLSGTFTVRAMTPQRIQDEIRYTRDTFGIHGYQFFDDEMNLSKDRTLGICQKIKELEDVVWRGFMVTAKFDEEIARACKESNCYEVASGIESGSPKILKAIRKPATVEINRRFIITAKKAGLRVKAFMIIGLKNESWDTIRETDNFLQGLRDEGYAPDDVDFSLLQIYKGAPLYKSPGDIIFKRNWSEASYYKSSPSMYEDLVQVRTEAMTEKDLLAARAYLESKYKPEGWVEDSTDRKDLDKVYANIEYARRKLQIQD